MRFEQTEFKIVFIILIFLVPGLVFSWTDLSDGVYIGMFDNGNEWVFFKVKLKNQINSIKAKLIIPSWETSYTNDANVCSNGAGIKLSYKDAHNNINFQGELENGIINGVASREKFSGKFSLYPLTGISLKTYKKYIGNYTFTDRDSILVGVSWGRFRYYESESYVMIYPIGSEKFLSERGEILSFLSVNDNDQIMLRMKTINGKLYSGVRDASSGEEEVVFENHGIKLSGTLLKPVAVKPVPAVVMVHGSGPQDREPFRVIADKFVKRGVAVLIYDKRGVGQSGGCWQKASISELASDALAAVDFLGKRSDIDPEKIALNGGSQAGWVIPFAAARSDKVAYIMIIAGPAIDPVEQDLYRIHNILKEQSFCPDSIRKSDQLLEYFYSYILEGKNKNKLERLLKKLHRDERFQLLTEKVFKGLKSDFYYKFGFDYNPVEDFAKITVPVLCIWGELDKIVPPYKSMEIIKRTLSKAGNSDVTFKIFPNANHILRTAKTGGQSEWHKLRQYAPGFFDFQVEWMLARIKK